MFSKELVSKAITDSTWRNFTALGRKVAGSINALELNERAEYALWCEENDVDSNNCLSSTGHCVMCNELEVLDAFGLCHGCHMIEGIDLKREETFYYEDVNGQTI